MTNPYPRGTPEHSNFEYRFGTNNPDNRSIGPLGNLYGPGNSWSGSTPAPAPTPSFTGNISNSSSSSKNSGSGFENFVVGRITQLTSNPPPTSKPSISDFAYGAIGIAAILAGIGWFSSGSNTQSSTYSPPQTGNPGVSKPEPSACTFPITSSDRNCYLTLRAGVTFFPDKGDNYSIRAGMKITIKDALINGPDGMMNVTANQVTGSILIHDLNARPSDSGSVYPRLPTAPSGATYLSWTAAMIPNGRILAYEAPSYNARKTCLTGSLVDAMQTAKSVTIRGNGKDYYVMGGTLERSQYGSTVYAIRGPSC